ncbi:hypothetical protein RV10_GL004076 [Enterococcus pallens]|nr:hypothetical protein RV10_GL004076 [Enterococcus pallens]
MVLIQMDRQGKNWKYLASLIEKSDTYTKQVVSKVQNGPKAEEYRKIIAENLGIVYESEGLSSGRIN